MTTVPVRISIASMWQRFHGCEPEYIRTVCFGRCCDAPSRPSGTMISIHPSEVPVIVRRGGRVEGGLLVTPERKCTFKDENHLCSLHMTPDKPFGCIASPFTLNAKDCLIVRNRYRMLPCYRKREEGDGYPAWEAFQASLNLIFGDESAEQLRTQLLEDSVFWPDRKFIPWQMPTRSYEILRTNDQIKRAAGH